MGNDDRNTCSAVLMAKKPLTQARQRDEELVGSAP